MTKIHALLITLIGVVATARGDFTISQGGDARCRIIQSTNATQAEIHAARELAETLGQITGGRFEVRVGKAEGKLPEIIVGAGEATAAWFPEYDFSKFG